MERTKPKSKSMTLASARMKLFGEPQLLEGEDAAAYDELLARIRAAVKPVDIVEEMFIADVVTLEWELLRWRRLKLGLIRARVLEALKAFLVEKLDYDLYRDDFADDLAEVLQDNLADDQKKGSAQTLAHKCAQNEPEAVDEVREFSPASTWTSTSSWTTCRPRRRKSSCKSTHSAHQKPSRGSMSAWRALG
jgi:hypothetical protein